MAKIYNQSNSTVLKAGFLEVVGVHSPRPEETLIYEVVNKKDAVVCLVLSHDLKKVYTTTQWRPCANKEELGLVAGILDKEGKHHKDIIIEEIEEEIRVSRNQIKTLEYLGAGFSSSGMTTEKVHRYLAILTEDVKFDDTLQKASDTDYITKDIMDFNFETYSKLTSNTSQLLFQQVYMILFGKSIIPQKRIAVYGGCFSPFTVQHLNVVIRLIESTKLDKVLIAPCSDFYTKKKVPYILRKEIIEAYVSELPQYLQDKILVSDIENVRFEPTSYETLVKARDLYGYQNKYYSIFGTDNIEQIDKDNWKHRDEMMEEFNIIAIERTGYEMSRILQECPFIIKNVEKIKVIPPVNDNQVSSTKVRELLFSGLEICGLTSPKSAEVIKNNIKAFKKAYGRK